ncbi:MAG: 5-(carboxyamino)imidazole ribonucleotide synthase [Bacteroidia bacterium]|nr:5-(carboxyamino)imidazole ribonucleotide synthase [Bacteroidia bacterium]
MLPYKGTIGIIGGGQLGKMLIESSRPWNIDYAILDLDDAPAKHLAKHFIYGSLTDGFRIEQLSEISDVMTYEIEHIDVKTLLELEEAGKVIIPSPKILEIIQDKGLQKLFYRLHKVPTLNFELVDEPSQLKEKLALLNGKMVAVKSRTDGYDGKGVALLSFADLMGERVPFPFAGPVLLEEFAENAIELSVIVARDAKGNVKTYPTCEMQFDPKANLVEYLFAPASIDEKTDQKAQNIAIDVINKLHGVGVFAVELFLDEKGDVYVNEIAPRPHNSGHHTIEACYTSQYEQLNRILLGMPLGDTSLIQPAAMLNLLGAEGVSGKYEITGLDEILSIPGVYIHLYNKAETRPKRKMGHITIMAPTIEEVKVNASKVKAAIGMKQL